MAPVSYDPESGDPRLRNASAATARPAPLAWLLSALVVALAMSLYVPAARGATYKWVDEKGVVHYTDKIPADAVNKGSTVLDKQARPVKKIEPALTPEQRAARDAEDESRRLSAKAQEETARRDRALISSYTTEAEIELARSRALGTIDAQIESSQAYTATLVRRRTELDQRKASLGGKPMPAALEREFESNESELAKTAELIEQKRRERSTVVARYDSDRMRWRELKAVADANAAAAAASPKSTHPGVAGANGGTRTRQ
jgi:hypothetical protein